MFSSKADRITIADLNKRIDALTLYNEQLSKQVEDLGISARNCTVVCDFKSMQAFSLERVTRGSSPATVVGYIRPDNSVGEWYLRCNEEQHERLAKEFVQYVSKKK